MRSCGYNVFAAVQVLNIKAPKKPVISCFTSATTYQQGWPAVESLLYNSTVATWRTPFLNSTTVNGTNVSTSGMINGTWSTTYNTSSNISANSTQNQTQLFIEPFLCASYKMSLCPPGEDCQGYESVPGVGGWAYYPLTLSQCYQMQWMSHQPDSLVEAVTCCSTDDCNTPDPTLDNATSIIGTRRAIDSGLHACLQGVLVEQQDSGSGVGQVCVAPGE
jgi:hypothetical protein